MYGLSDYVFRNDEGDNLVEYGLADDEVAETTCHRLANEHKCLVTCYREICSCEPAPTRALELRRATDGGLIPLPEIGTSETDKCPYCKGNKKIYVWYKWKRCPICHGTGIRPVSTDKQGGEEETVTISKKLLEAMKLGLNLALEKMSDECDCDAYMEQDTGAWIHQEEKCVVFAKDHIEATLNMLDKDAASTPSPTG